jgi:hypothetical protein
MGSADYASVPGDTPASTVWTPRFLGDVEIDQTAVGAVGLGGRAALAAEAIEVWDGDGFAADLARYGTATGRAVALRLAEVRAPPRLRPRDAAGTGPAGVCRHRSCGGPHRAAARPHPLANATDRLNTLLQPILCQGTGGLEGGADLKGKPKPVALGRVFNAAPVFLGNLDLGAGALPTWQSSWRAVLARDAVRIRGVAQALVAGSEPAQRRGRRTVTSALLLSTRRSPSAGSRGPPHAAGRRSAPPVAGSPAPPSRRPAGAQPGPASG